MVNEVGAVSYFACTMKGIYKFGLKGEGEENGRLQERTRESDPVFIREGAGLITINSPKWIGWKALASGAEGRNECGQPSRGG